MRFCILTSAFCLLASLVQARQPGFDPKDVVRRARPRHTGAATLIPDAGEFLIDTTIQYVAAPGYQQDPAVAFDGVNFLVVWTDWVSDSSSGIYATRVTPAGALLDPSAIVLSTAGSEQQSPAVAFDGTNFLAVWVDNRDSGYDVFAARVTPQGTVLDPSSIPVSTAQYDQEYPAVAFDGTDFLVVWSNDWRSDSSSDIYAARVTPQGTVLDPTGFAVSTAAGAQSSPTVAFDGVNSLVTWSDPRSDPYGDIYAARVTPQGTVLDPSGIVISAAANSQESPFVAFDGTEYLVAWYDTRSTNYADVYAARVTPAGTVLDPSGIAVSTAAGYQNAECVAFDGTNFWVTWSDYRSGTAYGDIYAARVTPQGTVLDPSGIAVSAAANDQSYPAVAFDGANYLVTWMDNRGGSSYDIYAARVTPQGTVLDASGIAVAADTNDQLYPAVAFDGTNFLLSWTDDRSDWQGDIYAARVTPQGTVLDPTGILVCAAGEQQYPDVAFDGTNSFVAWGDYRSGSNFDIYCARVTPAGVVEDSGPVVKQAGDQLGPALARGTGSQLFLVYQGWAGTVGNRTYNTSRIWGRMNPAAGIEETRNDARGTTSGRPTIVRGVLALGGVGSRQNTADRAELLDISGCKVMELRAGANDVSRLAPGVYFMRQASGEQREASSIIKVVSTR
ncbi:MAG TPA: hypothetical protein VMH22_04440 [bacterium]|nr:hypothetical protein [bacterium]